MTPDTNAENRQTYAPLHPAHDVSAANGGGSDIVDRQAVPPAELDDLTADANKRVGFKQEPVGAFLASPEFGITVLDNDCVDLDGVRFFGSTLWSDFEKRSATAMNGVRRRMGEYFFVKKRSTSLDGEERLAKFRPQDAANAFDTSWSDLQRCLVANPSKPTITITHHAPSRQGTNPAFAGNGLDGAYASDLDATIARCAP